MTEEVLVIDIGGTKTNVSFVTSANSEIKVLSSDIFPTHLNPALQIEKISSLCLEKSNKPNYMSLSLPGLWDKDGVLIEGFNLKDWTGFPFIKNLANALNIKDYTWGTDVICGALGEYNYQTEKSLLYINLGTGIGGAFIRDGRSFKSNSSLTLRLQKLLLPDQGELISAVDLISGKDILKGTAYNSVKKLYLDYKVGNINTFEIITKAQLQLASWLINLFYLFAPDVIILNGGLTYDWEILCEEAIDIANEELKNQVKILPSRLKEMAPVYGAYLNYKTPPI